ncbi:MAG: HAMP domain-containing sensor histidine kinase [Ferruginibacter sp.]
MKYVFTVFAYLWLCVVPGFAQKNETATSYVNICQGIINNTNGKGVSYSDLIKNGSIGLSLAKADDYGTLCQLNNFIAVGYYNQFKFDSAKKYFENTHHLSLQSNRGDNGAYALGALTQIYHYLNNNAKSDSTAKMLQAVLDTSTSNTVKSTGFYTLGRYHASIKSFINLGLADYLQSLVSLKPLIDTAISPKFKLQYAITSISIADIYLQLKQPDKALQYAKAGEKYAPALLSVEVGMLCRFVKTYAALYNIDSALQYHQRLIATAGKSNVPFSELVTSNIALANYYIKNNQPESAKAFVDSAQARAKLTTKLLMSQADAISGDYYLQKNDFVSAKKFYTNAVDEMYNADRTAYCDIRKTLANIAMQEGNTTDAKKQFALYVQANDSLTMEKTSINLAEMEAKFQNKEKQQQIENKNLQLKVGRNKILWLITGAGLLFLVAILLLVINRNKKKTANILQEKNTSLAKLNSALEEANKTKAKLFGIISHDLRSPISQVYQFLKLQQLNPKLLNDEQKNELSTKIQTATGSLLETMEDLLLWSKTQMNEFKVNMTSVKIMPVIDACKNLLQLNSDAKNITYNILIDSNITASTDAYFLQTIIRNLLQNAIKASPENGAIEISANTEGNNLVFAIKNDGANFSQQQYQQILTSEEAAKSLNGLGLRLVDELAKKIGAFVQFKTLSTQGTLAEIHLPQ